MDQPWIRAGLCTVPVCRCSCCSPSGYSYRVSMPHVHFLALSVCTTCISDTPPRGEFPLISLVYYPNKESW